MNSDLIHYSPIVDALLDGAKNLTARDFVDLAIAALDQAGVHLDAQHSVRQIAEAELERAEAQRAGDLWAAAYREQLSARIQGQRIRHQDEQVSPEWLRILRDGGLL